MANEEQLEILKQGVEVWNQWRQAYPDVDIDLRGADLRRADLCRVDFHNGDFWRTDLRLAKLRKANLCRARLDNTYLIRADLRNTDLRRANLSNAHLDMAYLHNANLHEAILHRAKLIGTDLSQAIITGVKFYGTARDDWIITGVKCDYVYWDHWDKERTPKDRDFRPGEFEELYKQLPTFIYYFEHGFTPLDPLIMDQVVQAINERHPEIELRLDSFHSRGQPHAVFTVIHKDYTEKALKEVTAAYERILRVLEEQKEQRMDLEEKVEILEIEKEQLMKVIERLSTGARINNKPQQIGDVIIGNKMITAGQDYFEHVQGNVDMQRARGDIVQGDKVDGDSITTEVRGNIDLKGDTQQLAIGKDIQQRNSTVSEGGTVNMGDKHIGRDNIEISGNAHVEQFTTGASFQGDYAQQLLQSTTPQSSKEDILKLLSFVQQELPKLSLPEDVKEEVANEFKGAEIQAKKEEPDKKKIGEKLQNATEALKKVPKLTKAAITVGNLLGQAILWCGMKWVEWKYGE